MFEAHGMSFQCTELLLFNYAKVKTVFHSMAPLNKVDEESQENQSVLWVGHLRGMLVYSKSF